MSNNLVLSDDRINEIAADYMDSSVGACVNAEIIAMAKEIRRRRAEQHPPQPALQSQLDQLSGKLEGAVAVLSARIAALEARPAAPQWPIHGLPWSPTCAPMRLEPGVDAIKREDA